LASAFGSTYTREQALTCMKQNKWKFCPRITDVHLLEVMWIGIAKTKPKVHSLGIFLFNVHLYVDNGKDM